MKSFKEWLEENTVNVGTQKYPMHAKKTSGNKVKNFKQPTNGAGDHDIHHNGEHYSYTGKSGTNRKTGQPSHEYSTANDKRVWVHKNGTVEED